MHLLCREGVLEVVDHGRSGREFQIEMSAFLRRDFSQPPVEDSLGGADKLNNRDVAGREFGFDRLEDRRHLHRDQQCRPEALLGAFEPAQRRSLSHCVQGSARGAINDIGGFQCGVDIAMNHGLSRGSGNAEERGVTGEFP